MSIWRKFFSCSGRIGRMDFFWLATASLFVPSIGVGVFFGQQIAEMAAMPDLTALQVSANTFIGLLILLIVLLFISWILFAISSKRLHDIGYSNWWQLLYALPPTATILIIILLFAPGSPIANKYGPPPETKN